MDIYYKELKELEIKLNDLERKCLDVEEKIIIVKELIEEKNKDNIYGEEIDEEFEQIQN